LKLRTGQHWLDVHVDAWYIANTLWLAMGH
jgi:hypothetical protein